MASLVCILTLPIALTIPVFAVDTPSGIYGNGTSGIYIDINAASYTTPVPAPGGAGSIAQTGDGSRPAVWLCLAAMALFGLGGAHLLKKRASK